jgi:hypothetical protein
MAYFPHAYDAENEAPAMKRISFFIDCEDNHAENVARDVESLLKSNNFECTFQATCELPDAGKYGLNNYRRDNS